MPELKNVFPKKTLPPPCSRVAPDLYVVEQHETADHPGSIPTSPGYERWAGAFKGRRATCS